MVRAYRKRLGNPYACQEEVEEVHGESALHVSGNPWRTLPPWVESNPEEPAIGVPEPAEIRTGTFAKTPSGSLTKDEFRGECRQIFLPYVPRGQGRTLLSEHRDFIRRNERRSPQARYRLVLELRRFDISNVGLRPHFNREPPSGLTVRKLREIEARVGAED